MQIKLCGLTRREDIMLACRLGVNALGFILAPSPRQVSLADVRVLTVDLPPFIQRVAVVVNPDKRELKEIITSGLFDYIQFHGEEEPEVVAGIPLKTIKAFSISSRDDFTLLKKYDAADYFLFDSKSSSKRGGTGLSFDWELLKGLKINKPFILAGGLGPENIGTALKRIKMAGIDLNSKVESSPGVKDPDLLNKVIREIREFQLNYGKETG